MKSFGDIGLVLLGAISYLFATLIVAFTLNPKWISEMTSSELAAWLQAIGSVGAILAAIQISSKQFQDGLRLERIRAEAERQRRHEVLGAVIDDALIVLAQALDALQTTNPNSWFDENSTQEQIEDFYTAMRQISPLDMPSANTAKALFKIRDLLGTAAWNVNTALKTKAIGGSDFEQYVTAMQHNLGELRQEHSKLVQGLY